MKPAADVIEDIEFLDATGVGALEAAERCGFASGHAMEQWLYRHDQLALFNRLKARDPEGAHTATGIGRQRFDGNGGNGRVDALLIEAGKSPLARTRKRGQKIRDLIQELATSLAAERVDIEEKEAARKEIEKLERQLAAAKARLRGKPTATVSASAEVRSITPGEYPCRLGCGETFTTGQGRSAHERRSAAHRVDIDGNEVAS